MVASVQPFGRQRHGRDVRAQHRRRANFQRAAPDQRRSQSILTNGTGSARLEWRRMAELILCGWIHEMPRTTSIRSYSTPTAPMAVLRGRLT